MELVRVGIGRARDGAANVLVDRAGRRAPLPLEQRAHLVDDDRVAARGEDVEQRLRAEDLADRRRERRRPDLGADAHDLDQHLVEAVARRLPAQVRVERRDEARRKVVLGGAHGDARRERRDRLVADVLVDEIRRLPELLHVDAGCEAEPGERLREALARDAVQRQRDRVDGGRDQVGAGARSLERDRERVAARALAVDADRQARRLREAA